MVCSSLRAAPGTTEVLTGQAAMRSSEAGRDLTPASAQAKLVELPRRGSHASPKVRDRSLRTQQRAESQCQFFNPVRGWREPIVAEIPLVMTSSKSA